jgi:DNA-directed RNA polymerase specialized sigma24 family protein
MSEHTVSSWVNALKEGNDEAAQRLMEIYFQRLVALARSRLLGVPKRMADEEDVALSAFDSFCRGAQRGRFPRLNDRNGLWQLLVAITKRKACNLARHESRPSRGAGRVRSLSDLAEHGGEEVEGTEPTPEFAAQVTEECRRLMQLLRNDTLRQVALWKMEGYTNEEIAAKLGCVCYTVERKLRAIRQLWSAEAP